MSARFPDPSTLRLTYGITPPRRTFSEAKLGAVAAAQAQRIATLPIDALVIYDLQDESSRTKVPRPFPFVELVDPLRWAYDDLASVPQPRIVYRSVAGQTPAELGAWFDRLDTHGGATVLVGAPSRVQEVTLRLDEAYELRREHRPTLPLGGIAIAERHQRRHTEHERLLTKSDRGCGFFITQAVFSVASSLDLLSDLYYRCHAEEREIPPVLVTLSPCGSRKTLEFMRWLGVSVPRWIDNEISHAGDPLATSVELALASFEQLLQFARAKSIPLGCNVESVSRRRAEIDASVELVERAAALLGRTSPAS